MKRSRARGDGRERAGYGRDPTFIGSRHGEESIVKVMLIGHQKVLVVCLKPASDSAFVAF